MKQAFQKIESLVNGQQHSISSAAGLVMLMMIFSRIFGLLRQWVLAHYFFVEDLSLFFAAFRLPDTIFEVLVFGTFASAFIPTFTKTLRISKTKAWRVAGIVANWGGIIFLILAGLVVVFAHPLYKLITPGFSALDQVKIADLARILFVAQGFFVISYVLTAVLESSKRFFVPALAPLFYNFGIIIFTILFSKSIGLYAPVAGVVVGAALHFLIQLPLAIKLGFRFTRSLSIIPEVKTIAKLSIPKIIEVSFLQISKFVELTLASLVSAPAYTYFTFGNTIQLLPVGLFGTSIAKAVLPALARQTDNLIVFKKILFETLNQVVFLMTPIAAFLIVARVPVVRLVFGTDIFTWNSTVETSLVVSAFALGILSQAANSILSRAFYALSDTKTPVRVSVVTLAFNIVLDYVLVIFYKMPVWGLALAFSVSAIIQSIILFVLITKRMHGGREKFVQVMPVLKSLIAGIVSGGAMFFTLKIFDKSVWIKKLSFITHVDSFANADLLFEKFVLDTRYTGNLLILTVVVGLVGCVVYILILKILRSEELQKFANLFKGIFAGQKLTLVSTVSTERDSID